MSNSSCSRSKFSWLIIVCITFLQATCTPSIIATYSSLLEHHICTSQVQFNYLVVALHIGRHFGWLSGTAAIYLPMWMILFIGLIFQVVAYGVQYLHLINKVPSLSYWHVFLLNVLAGNSACWINTYCHLVATRNFNDNLTTTITALTSSYSALGGKLYTALAAGITGKYGYQNSGIYLLLSCFVPTIVGSAVAPLLSCPRLMPFGGPDIFPMVFVIAFVTGACALLESIASPFKYVPPQLRIVILVLVIVLPSAVPPAIHATFLTLRKWCSQVKPEMRTADTNSNSQTVIEISSGEEKREIIEKAGVQVEQVRGKKGDAKVGDEHGVKDLVMSLDFWLYFSVNACGITLAMVYGNNLERISQSRGNHEVSFLIVLSSLFGFFGRVFAVSFDWYTRERKMLSRPALIAFIMIPMPASFFLLTSDSNTCLYVTTSILGACSGAIGAMATSTTSELFGHDNAVINLNIVLMSIPMGSLLFGHLAALNYDRDGGSTYAACTGLNCHQKTFVIWGIICAVGTILSSILHLRTQKFYSKLL